VSDLSLDKSFSSYEGSCFDSPEAACRVPKKSPDDVSHPFSPEAKSSWCDWKRCKYSNEQHVNSGTLFLRLNYSLFSMIEELSGGNSGSRVLLHRKYTVFNKEDKGGTFEDLIRIHNIRRIALFYLQAVVYESAPSLDKVTRGKPLQVHLGSGAQERGEQAAHHAILPSLKNIKIDDETGEKVEVEVIRLGSDLEAMLSDVTFMPEFINRDVDKFADNMRDFICERLKKISKKEKDVVTATLEVIANLLMRTRGKIRETGNKWSDEELDSYVSHSGMSKNVDSLANFALRFNRKEFMKLLKSVGQVEESLSLDTNEGLNAAFNASFPEYSNIPKEFIKSCKLKDREIQELKDVVRLLKVQCEQLEVLSKSLIEESQKGSAEGAENTLALGWITPLLYEFDRFSNFSEGSTSSTYRVSRVFLESLNQPKEVWECSACIEEKLNNASRESRLFEASLFRKIDSRIEGIRSVIEGSSTLSKREQADSALESVFGTRNETEVKLSFNPEVIIKNKVKMRVKTKIKISDRPRVELKDSLMSLVGFFIKHVEKRIIEDVIDFLEDTVKEKAFLEKASSTDVLENKIASLKMEKDSLVNSTDKVIADVERIIGRGISAPGSSISNLRKSLKPLKTLLSLFGGLGPFRVYESRVKFDKKCAEIREKLREARARSEADKKVAKTEKQRNISLKKHSSSISGLEDKLTEALELGPEGYFLDEMKKTCNNLSKEQPLFAQGFDCLRGNLETKLKKIRSRFSESMMLQKRFFASNPISADNSDQDASSGDGCYASDPLCEDMDNMTVRNSLTALDRSFEEND
jgi:hypothetical protein